MTETIRPFNIMAKPVCGVCNLDCAYCYYTMKPRELYPEADRFMMSDEVLDSYTRQYLETMGERVDFGWQGGEPLLAGKEFFRKAFAKQKEYARPGQIISNAVQTNGTLIDEEWAQLLADNRALVGLSLDGPAQWHDYFRRDRDGHPSFHRAWRGLELLRDAGVEYNVLVTLNSINAPHAGDIYRFFVNRGIQYIQFIPILERTADGQPTPFSCTGEQFGQFLLEVFDIWSSRDIGRVSERFIDNVIHTLLFDKAAMCCHADRCANAHVLEFNGDLYACDHFVHKQWKIGNLLERPLAELVGDDRLEQFAQLKTELPAACRDCQFLTFCRGGCPKHHVPIGTDPDRVNHFCEGYKLFFRQALEPLREMAEIFRKGQTPPLRGAAPASAPPPAGAGGGPGSAGGVGKNGGAAPRRNAPCPCGSGRKYKHCCGKAG